MRIELILVLCTSIALLPGCNFFRDVGDVSLQPGGSDVGDASSLDAGGDADAAGPRDADTGDDVGDDMTADAARDMRMDVAADVGDDIGIDTGPDFGPCGPPSDVISPVDFGEVTSLGCDPSKPDLPCQNDSTLTCKLFFSPQSNEFVPGCAGDQYFGPQMNGDVCGADAPKAERCAAGLDCFGWSLSDERDPRGHRCAYHCHMADDLGCPAGEYCSWVRSELPGLGLCVPECDPYMASSCPTGAVCAVDFSFPDSARLPRFRCRVDSNSSTGTPSQLGEACGFGSPDSPHRDCTEGTICYPSDPLDLAVPGTCVRPCQDDSDCADIDDGSYVCPECGEGAWELRYCQPPTP